MTGLGGLFCYPQALVVGLALGLFLFYGLKLKQKWLRGLFIAMVLLIQGWIQLTGHPQDYPASTTEQLMVFYSAHAGYDTLKYADFPLVNYAERVSYIYKFQHELPDRLIALTISGVEEDRDYKNHYLIE